MKIIVRNPSNCPCGEKWLLQNEEGSHLCCTAGHAWDYSRKWSQVSLSFLEKATTQNKIVFKYDN